ncbi:MAG: undecaprenyldiphospho-muramoylpentapeptide beta-N-acetylglucosaminyltransferase [Rhodospirillaceae bacterium]|nr:undecaprenyldiphospho-muramoylpentapeptide beta-N-acetylglucosaminyltransferase [Rhodospirillaceae bacterium]
MNAPTTEKLIVLSSGGTGGHVFPAQALAQELATRGFRLALVTDRRGETYGPTPIGSSADEATADSPLADLDTYFIKAAGVSGRGPVAKLVAVSKLIVGYFQARRLLRDLSPAVVVGFGGYPTVPTLLAASHLGIKTVIHEQNAVLGRANRLLAPKATRIATAFKTTTYLRDSDRARNIWTGNPVRAAIAALHSLAYPTIDANGPIHLLIVGSSQGASIFGDVAPNALAALPDELRARIRVVQQCRAEDLERVRRVYATAGIDADLRTFFDDIPARIQAAHLLICRAGASTIAEITTAGRPAILTPYPHAIDDHQTVNAARLCDSGGAWMIPNADFNKETLLARLTSLFSMPTTIATAARCAAQLGVPEAASRLADVVAGVTRGDGKLTQTSERRALA